MPVASLAVALGVAIGIAQEAVPANRVRPNRSNSSAPAVGVGIALTHGEEYPEIARILPGSPAARSGKLRPGDRVIAIGVGAGDPVSTKPLSVQRAVSLIRGTPGTVVVLTVLPRGKPLSAAFPLSLTRGTIRELNVFGDGHYPPAGETAPDLRGDILPDGTSFEPKILPGHVMVLEFWATWCGPCLTAIDRLQQMRRAHPEWSDRATFVLVSVDDAKTDAAIAVKRRKGHWEGLTAVWAGPAALKQFHVDGLPAAYVIDSEGKVISAGHHVDLPRLLSPKRFVPTNDEPSRPPSYSPGARRRR